MLDPLNLSDKDIQFLIKLSREMYTQDTELQAQPVFWVIGDYEWRPTAEGLGDRSTIYVMDLNETSSFTANELADHLIENYDAEYYEFEDENDRQRMSIQIEELKDLRAKGYYVYDSVTSILDDMGFDYTEQDEIQEHIVQSNTLFLTKVEAERHIVNNRHHYTNEVHPYAMSAWRSPEVSRLYKIMEQIYKNTKGLNINE